MDNDEAASRTLCTPFLCVLRMREAVGPQFLGAFDWENGCLNGENHQPASYPLVI